jgi:PhzF family phenazine biosynthesis protein
MKLSETAFVETRTDGFGLRWFTPAVEVDLCGHATLAAAHVLWEEGRLPMAESARFDTRSGRLLATRSGGGVELDLPAVRPAPAEPRADLIAALGVRPVSAATSDLYDLVELASEAEVHAARPDFARLSAACRTGVAVTAPADDPALDFVSRFFAPALGVDEDPVTGSAHCLLGPFWGERLARVQLAARQVSRRGGRVAVRVRGDRVALGGSAVTVARGELLAT